MTLWCKDCRKFGTEYVPKSSGLRDDFQLVSVFISLCIIIPSSLGLMNKLHQWCTTGWRAHDWIWRNHILKAPLYFFANAKDSTRFEGILPVHRQLILNKYFRTGVICVWDIGWSRFAETCRPAAESSRYQSHAWSYSTVLVREAILSLALNSSELYSNTFKLRSPSRRELLHGVKMSVFYMMGESTTCWKESAPTL
jgi:hypothetical protein